MFDFLPSTELDESDPIADDPAVEPTETSASTSPTEATPAVVSDVAEETLADSAVNAHHTTDETEASADTAEADRPKATPEKEKPVVIAKAATGEEEVIDLPDFSHEPTEPGQYTLRIVFTFRPGDQSVVAATQSHDLLPLVSEVEPTVARALLATFIAAHEARLGEIKEALAKPTTKPSARSTAARKPATPTAAPKPSGVKKPKTVQPPAAKPTPALPQTNLFPD